MINAYNSWWSENKTFSPGNHDKSNLTVCQETGNKIHCIYHSKVVFILVNEHTIAVFVFEDIKMS